MTGARRTDDAGRRLADFVAARWRGVDEAVSAVDGPGWSEELPEPEIAIVEGLPPVVLFRFGDRVLAAEAGRVIDRGADGSARILSPRGAIVGSIPSGLRAADGASLN